MHQSERVSSTSGNGNDRPEMVEDDSDDTDSWPEDSTSQNENFYSDSEFDDNEASSSSNSNVKTNAMDEESNAGSCSCRSCSGRSYAGAMSRYQGVTRFPLSVTGQDPQESASAPYRYNSTRKIFSNHRYMI